MREQHSYDLHLHTEWSWDANATLKTYVETAEARKMRCLAITDHNNWDVAEEIAPLAEASSSLRVIQGTELYIRSEALDQTIHFLCYGIPSQLSGPLKQIQAAAHQWMRAGGEGLAQGIAHQFGVGEDEATRIAKNCRPEKTHRTQGLTLASQNKIMAALSASGIDAAPEEMKGLLAEMWEPVPEAPLASEIIPQLNKSDLVLVLAHPYYCFDGDDIRKLDLLREEFQFDGVECAHHRIEMDRTEILERYCQDHGLLSTAGTDNHGEENIATTLGVHVGSDAWLDPFMERVPVS